MSSEPSRDYLKQAADLDAALDVRLAELRQAADAGQINVVQAADLRVLALETHLAEHRALRLRCFGEEGL